MAYHTRTRDPLLETHMQAAIRKRGIELLGMLFIAIAFVFAVALWSYSPTDPSLLSATAEPVQNNLGVFGAFIAGTLMVTIGWAAWCIPLVFFIAGLRMICHFNEQRLALRALFTPLFIAISAIFLSTHAAPDSWPHGWGLGGFSGDAALEILIELNPVSLGLWVRLLSVFLGLATIWLGLFSTGFSWHEVKNISKYSVIGCIMIYSMLVSLGVSIIAFAYKLFGKSNDLVQRYRERTDGMPEINMRGRISDEAKSPGQMGRNTLFPTLPVFAERAQETLLRNKKRGAVREALETNASAETQEDASRVKRRIAEVIEQKGLSDRPSPISAENTIQNAPEPSLQSAPAAGLETAVNAAMDAQMEATESSPRMFKRASIPDPVAEADLPNNVFEGASGNGANLFPAADAGAALVDPVAPVRKVKPRRETVIKPGKNARKEAEPTLFSDKNAVAYEHPALSLLSNPKNIVRTQLSNEALEENARMLENVLDDYGVKGEITSVCPGPVVTMYELEPAPGLKASRVIGLSDDIARSMSALSARVSTVPGRTVIGIELPNESREVVLLREILAGSDFGDSNLSLPLALGKDIGGKAMVADLAKMPHLLIAGTTGSGKSVAINTMILSLLYKLSPEECRMIMIDPKMLELSVYDGIPHLLSPVVTDPKKAVVALKWVVGEMEERYRKMSKMGVRNIAGYNSRVEDALAKGENFDRTVQTGFDDETGEPIFETESLVPEKLPFIVVVVDEMADLMMVAGKEIEACIQRLAQMARASGIHLIMATQRPSVDVITGTIKANFPTRISFQVTSKVDSRTILGEMGAEQLLGMGDMLYMAGGGKITRVHGPFVSDEEVEVIVNHLKIYGPPEYVSGVVKGPDDESSSNIDAVLGLGGNTNAENALYDQAVAIVAQDRKCSTSYIQRKLSIGYNKAAKLVEEMEENGIVSSANHVGKREILLPEN